MARRTTWLIDMGDGTWAVSCTACRIALFRGPQAGADRAAAPTTANPSSPSAAGAGRPDGRARSRCGGATRTPPWTDAPPTANPAQPLVKEHHAPSHRLGPATRRLGPALPGWAPLVDPAPPPPGGQLGRPLVVANGRRQRLPGLVAIYVLGHDDPPPACRSAAWLTVALTAAGGGPADDPSPLWVGDRWPGRWTEYTVVALLAPSWPPRPSSTRADYRPTRAQAAKPRPRRGR